MRIDQVHVERRVSFTDDAGIHTCTVVSIKDGNVVVGDIVPPIAGLPSETTLTKTVEELSVSG